jgi:hypothetical protein
MDGQGTSQTQNQRQQTQSTSGQQSQSSAPQVMSRQEQEQASENRTLAEFLLMLDDYEPLVCISQRKTSSSRNSITF